MADAWALQQIGNYKNGKILLWSWISRGLISMEQLASWHFNQNLEEAQQFLESASGELRKLADLDELPEPHEPGDASGVAKAETTVMSGEVTSLWSITDPENPQAAPIVLPQWFVGPIDKAILIWKQESAIWKQRKEKRLEQGHDQLTPKMQEAYEQWMSDTARSIILNKKTKTQVKNFTSKSRHQLKKTCLLLVIQMADKAENLMISAGAGKIWRLALIQGQLPPTDAVPAEVDHFSGDLPQQPEMLGDAEYDDNAATAEDVELQQADQNMVGCSEDEGENLHPDMVQYMFVDTDSDSEGEACDPIFAKAKRVRVLESQPEYQRLKDLGLATRPHGCSLGCHPAARVYRAQSACSAHFSRSWGSDGRNAWQALLRVVELMLESHIKVNASDRLARKQLGKIQGLRAAEPPHKD